ncbi:radical SAM/SPASM domain-containing protein [Larkinella rosea]|uniref:Radical SAM protein n=1 Tax=Larkinella rosea TaxID=2025312 RepID=A0A3P1BDN4_9BACT|nr:radical SAM protein [Larkinella rosea]RRA98613.1 radical SAM protein [Larkinella rosea]
MVSAIPIKSPNLLIRPIDDKHFYVVNCAYPHSLRILNQTQHEIISAIDNQANIVTLADRLSMPLIALEQFIELLSKTEIIRFDNHFSKPQKPASTKSLNFWIHTTNSCNLTCGYCYISTLNTTGGMQEATKKKLLQKLVETVKKRKLTNIKFRLAGGEPLTQFKSWKSFITEVKQALNELDCELQCSFITNLTILTDEIIQFSKANNISYGVSIDGVERHHNTTRAFRSGVGSFKTVDANLRKLLAHNIPVSTSTVVSNVNLEGLPDLTRYLIDLDLPFRYSIVKGEGIDGELLDRYLSQSYLLMKEALQTGWRFSTRHQFCDLKPSELGFQTCASGFSGGAVYVDGTVNYCHVHFGDTTKQAHSIFDDQRDLVDMVEQTSHYEGMKSQDCQSCRYKSVCTSGCPVYRIEGKDPQCSLYHKFIPLIYELQAKERLKLLRDYQMI